MRDGSLLAEVHALREEQYEQKLRDRDKEIWPNLTYHWRHGVISNKFEIRRSYKGLGQQLRKEKKHGTIKNAPRMTARYHSAT